MKTKQAKQPNGVDYRCLVSGSHYGCFCDGSPTLHAAAPDLLALLKEWNLVGFLPTQGEWQEWEKGFGDRVRVAITKAEGSKP